MNAHSCKPSSTTMWLSPKAGPDPPSSFQRKALSYPGATSAFTKLATKIDPNLLWRHLWGLANLKKIETRQNIKGRGNQWYGLPGLPPHTLRRFPRRLRATANEIESLDKKIRANDAYAATVNLLPVYLADAIPGKRYELQVNGETVRSVGTGTEAINPARADDLLTRKDEFPRLTEVSRLLRLYADYAEAVCRLTAYHAPKGGNLLNAGMRTALIDLVGLVGKSHWGEIATLMTAAYNAIACNAQVDPKALQMQHKRFRKK